MLGIYIYIGIYFLGTVTFWSDLKIGFGDDISISHIVKIAIGISQPFLMYLYFINSEDRIGFSKLSLISLVFIFISATISLISLHMFPGASRSLAQGSASLNFMLHEMYQKIGIVSYTFYSALAFLMPAIAFLIKNTSRNIYKTFYIIAFIISAYSLIKAEHTTIMIFAFALFLLGFITPKNRRAANTIILFFIVLVFIFSNYLANLLHWIGNILSDDQNGKIALRLDDLAKAIDTKDFDPETGQTYLAGERISRSVYSWKSFIQNPLIGSGTSGGHAYWLDILGKFGLLGILPWIIIFRQFIKRNHLLLNKSVLFLFNMSFIGLLLFGLIKNLGGIELWMALFFVLPGIYLVYNSSKSSKKTNKSYLQ